MTLCAVGALLGALALGGCSRRDDVEVARSNDSTTVTQSRSIGDQVQKDAQATKEATKEAANDVKDAARGAADQATNKVADAMITTSVNAELAKDPKLSAMHIDVDTSAGRVALRGTAPDAEAKARASQLASAVKGVVSVENYLTVQGKG